MKHKFLKYLKLILAIYYICSIWIVKSITSIYTLIGFIQILARIIIAILLFYDFVKDESTIQKREDRL